MRVRRTRRTGPWLAVAAMVVALLRAPVAAALVSCTTSASGVSFGVYDPLSSAPNAANGSLSVTCSLLGGAATSVPISIGLSSGSSGSHSARSLVSGSFALGYNLYWSAAYTQIWGDGSGGTISGTTTLALTPAAPTQTYSGTMYGRIPAAQDVGAGAYVDTIVVTISY